MSKKVKKRKRKSKLSTVIIGFLAFVLILCLIGYGIFVILLNKMDTVKLDKGNLGLTSTTELSQYSNYKKIKNIALFGVDGVDGVGRSDSIMIATIDPVNNKLKITSIMRDSYVNIEGYGYDKINHAYAFGGPELSIKTLNQTFGLNIEDFAAVDFGSLPIIIDSLGGIELDITEEELQYINSYIDKINALDGTNSPYITYAGTQHVNGVQAVAYSRIRYTSGGDYERTQRHRTVLEKLFEKALTIPVSQYPSLITELLPYVQTNLSSSDIISLGTKVVGMGKSTLEQERFPRDGFGQGINIDSVYYIQFDEAETKKQIMDYIFADK